MLLYDKNRVQIQGCEQLISISNTQIVVKCLNEKYVITGIDLIISELGQKQIIINGKIESLGIQYA